MAKKQQRGFTITLSDKDGAVNADVLVKTIENALEMLRSIEARMVAADILVEWELVKVRMRSPLVMTLEPRVKGRRRSAVGTKIVKAAIAGVGQIERAPVLSKFFDQDAMDATKKLFRVANDGGTNIKFSAPGVKPIQLTEQAVHNIAELSERARFYVDFSTIEGRLDIVSVHEGKSVVIWETLTDNKIECVFSDEQFAKSITLDMLGQRVAVSGRVSYRNHIPKKVHVEGEIRQLRAASALPQSKDMAPINLTDGESSEEFVRRMRDAQ